jgi:hypothetical protein
MELEMGIETQPIGDITQNPFLVIVELQQHILNSVEMNFSGCE